MNHQLLSPNERRKLFSQVKKQYGTPPTLLKGCALFLTRGKRRLYAAKEVVADSVKELLVESLGLYLGTWLVNGELRLSIEGSQLLGPGATRNVLELGEEEFRRWVCGEDLEKETSLRGFVIIKHGADYCGCGKVVVDERRGATIIHNYVPKARYARPVVGSSGGG